MATSATGSVGVAPALVTDGGDGALGAGPVVVVDVGGTATKEVEDSGAGWATDGDAVARGGGRPSTSCALPGLGHGSGTRLLRWTCEATTKRPLARSTSGPPRRSCGCQERAGGSSLAGREAAPASGSLWINSKGATSTEPHRSRAAPGRPPLRILVVSTPLSSCDGQAGHRVYAPEGTRNLHTPMGRRGPSPPSRPQMRPTVALRDQTGRPLKSVVRLRDVRRGSSRLSNPGGTILR